MTSKLKAIGHWKRLVSCLKQNLTMSIIFKSKGNPKVNELKVKTDCRKWGFIYHSWAKERRVSRLINQTSKAEESKARSPILSIRNWIKFVLRTKIWVFSWIITKTSKIIIKRLSFRKKFAFHLIRTSQGHIKNGKWQEISSARVSCYLIF
mgnify:CR=1 FL=1